MNKGSRQAGFTLVELMVVVLIIGILVAVAIPVFRAAQDNTQKKACYANQRTIEGSSMTFLAQHGDMPVSGAVDAASWAVPAYLKNAPTCPSGPSGNRYSIDTSGTVDDCAYGTIAHVHF